MRNEWYNLKENYTCDEKGLQGIAIDQNLDGSIYGIAVYRNDKTIGYTVRRNQSSMDILYTGFCKEDIDVGFWLCASNYE